MIQSSNEGLIPTGHWKFDPAWGWTIAVDTDKAPCPMCWGHGTVTTDDGYDENGMLTAEYEITCPRCLGARTFKLEQETDGTQDS